MIKLSVNELKNNKMFMDSLQKLMKTKEIDAKEKWKLYDVIKECEKSLIKVDSIIDDLIKKYATDNENGKISIDQNKLSKDQIQNFNNEYLSIINKDIEIPLDEKIILNDKAIDNFTVEELIILGSIISR